MLVKLVCGSPYPKEVPRDIKNGGAIFEALREFNTRILVNLPDPLKSETDCLRYGTIELGVFQRDFLLLVLMRIQHDQKPLEFDMPFNTKLIPDLTFPELSTPETRLFIDLHVIDSDDDNRITVLRSFTLHRDFTNEFIQAAKNQLTKNFTIEDFYRAYNDICRYTPAELMKKTTMYPVGI